MQIDVKKPTAKSKEKLRVCAYARVSTDSLEQEDSLENQTTYFTEYIKANPMWEFVGMYSDQGITGFKEKRSGFKEMIDEARAGNIDLIVVKSVSRFARNTETVLKFSRELKRIGVGIFFQLQNINTLSASGELLLTVIAAFAQAESEGASQNAKLTIKRKFEKGESGFTLDRAFGFCRDINGNICIDEEAAVTIQLMYDLAEQGIWQSKIKEYLNANGYKSPSGGKWNDTGVRRILRNEIYMGARIFQKTYLDSNRIRRKNYGQADMWYVEDDHPAIVSKEQWESVQKILDERLVKKEPIKKGKGYSRATYPLSGKLFCPYCGKVLIHRWDNGGRQEGWYCRTNIKVSKDACKGVHIPNEIAMEWGVPDEPITIVPFVDEYGMKQYTAYLTSEYEDWDECPYEKEVVVEKVEEPKAPRIKRTKVFTDEPRSTTVRYPLSGKLFCPYCDKKLSHKWEKGVEYWICSTNRNLHRTGGKRCKGLYFPAELAKEWGIPDEELIVVPYEDENGNRQFTAYPREEYRKD